ncbi:ribosomal protein L25, Ctc-form [Bacteriovorax sp. BSW11_IV]|uniref:50S ribosomal protein L25 n=1 Tax=Bacteriovorax sp. BSW11_IV TaxID=1353529 RepID=UPI00038A4F33|nr:50S ribosomal protein L25 [Bacteriovorax sp. BSW11_IV]EQC48890.1 ribosomal protein L25, Ctc-form [Bacteriovorax sp. BSW11_IV]
MYELLKTEFRDHKFKAPLRKMRTEGWVPGVLYGKGFASVNFMVKSMDFRKFNEHSGKVFEVEVKGYGKHLVTLDSIQYDHMGDFIQHIAFHKIAENEKTVVSLPIHLVGEAAGIKAGGMVQHVLHEAEVKGFPKDFVEFIEFDVSNLELHGHFCLKDIPLPKGLEWHEDINSNVVSCHPPRVVVEEAPAAPEAFEMEVPVAMEEKKEAA